MINAPGAHVSAAVPQIVGCLATRARARRGMPASRLTPGVVTLVAVTGTLALNDVPATGRRFAGCGAVPAATAALGLRVIAQVRPDRWNATGAVPCLAGAAVFLFAPRAG